MKVIARIIAPFFLLGTLLPISSVRAQTIISPQAPCPKPGVLCAQFTATSGPIPVIRSFTFNAPSAGKALVNFHGSLYCLTNSTNTSNALIEVVSHIATSSNSIISLTDPGSLYHNAVLTPPGTSGLNFTSTTFNLASTRVVNIPAAGPRTFYSRIVRGRMDPGTNCFVYNGAFTVVFTP